MNTNRSAFSGQPSAFRVGSWTFDVRRSLRSRAFTLVEVTLAIAVVAIGLVGVLALFPLGLRATRAASDDTQMAMIAQDYIAYYQQLALTNRNYDSGGPLPTGVLSTAGSPYGFAVTNDDIAFTGRVSVANSGFPMLTNGDLNLISRVTIEIWRPGSKTNTYVTEVARYVLP